MARTPDLRSMGALADHLGELATIPSRAAKTIAEDLTELLQEQFDRGVDPYGNAWAPLAERTLRKHGPPPLTESGDMASGTQARATSGAGIVIEVPFPGGIHQTGARRGAWRMPARPILPEGEELPSSWRKVIDAGIEKAFTKGARRGA